MERDNKELFSRLLKHISEHVEDFACLYGTDMDLSNFIMFYQFRLPESFLEEFSGDFNERDWDRVSEFQSLPETFIRKNADKVNWKYIWERQVLSEPFIKEFIDKVNWNAISYAQNLSEAFIRDYADKLNWKSIALYQQLSESFIEEFADRIDWCYISLKQNLSESFIIKHKNQLYPLSLMSNRFLSDGLKEKVKIIFDNHIEKPTTRE